VNEDVERIREINEAFGRADLDAVSASLREDAVWEHNLGRGTPEEGTYEGRDSIVRLLARILEPWEYIHLEPHEMRRLDGGTYLVRGEMHSKHRTSDAEVRTSYEQRIEIEDGLIARGAMTIGGEAARVE
jgi:ketosteroid isomerase-like protein